jgi:hypothetical protein
MKTLPGFLLFLLFAACSGSEKTNESNDTITSESSIDSTSQKNIKTVQGIRLEYTAQRSAEWNERIEMNASLHNDNIDTSYFLIGSCDPMQYHLYFDNTRFKESFHMVCNASSPIIAKIPPKGQYDFRTFFTSFVPEKTIRFGIDFYQVDKTFKLTDEFRVSYLSRPDKERTIVWGKDVEINDSHR